MNITITGTLGSGKSSVCKYLKEHGYEIISNGVIFRNIAAEKGVSVVELNKMAETDKSIDKLLDERSASMGREKDKAVFDARMGWHFIPDSFKVFLVADINEAARRVYEDSRVSESYDSIKEAKEVLTKRQLLEKERYLSLYGVDYLNLANYNLIIENTSVSPKDVAEQILSSMKEYATEKVSEQRVLLNPTSIYPTQNVINLKGEENASAQRSHESIQAMIADNHFYVLEGHRYVLDDILSKQKFTNVQLTCANHDRIAIDKSVICNFEDTGHFKYLSYPEKEDQSFLSFEDGSKS